MTYRFMKLSAALPLLMFSLASQASLAVTTTFTDRTSYEAVTSDTAFQDFEGILGEEETSRWLEEELILNGEHYLGISSYTITNSEGSGGSSSTELNLISENEAAFWNWGTGTVLVSPATEDLFYDFGTDQTTFNYSGVLTITLPTAVTSFGMDVMSLGNDPLDGFDYTAQPIKITVNGVDTVVTPSSSTDVEFFGITTDTPFTTITVQPLVDSNLTTVRSYGTDNWNYAIVDNLSYGF